LAKQALRTIGPQLAGDIYWIVEAEDEPVGRVSLYGINREHGRGEVGCLIGERYRGRGYGTAALRKLSCLALTTDGIDLRRLEATVAVGHVASRRMVERVGFQCEGIARAFWQVDDELLDVARYALLRPEW
jgi:ribosomal-protein-alanine N-acetyltransferase